MKEQKLKIKDLVTIGVFAVIYFVVTFAVWNDWSYSDFVPDISYNTGNCKRNCCYVIYG